MVYNINYRITNFQLLSFYYIKITTQKSAFKRKKPGFLVLGFVVVIEKIVMQVIRF